MNRVVDISVGSNHASSGSGDLVLPEVNWRKLIDSVKKGVSNSNIELTDDIKDCITSAFFKFRDLSKTPEVQELIILAQEKSTLIGDWFLDQVKDEKGKAQSERYLANFTVVTSIPDSLADQVVETITTSLTKATASSQADRETSLANTIVLFSEVLEGVQSKKGLLFERKVYHRNGMDLTSIEGYFFRNTAGTVMPLQDWAMAHPHMELRWMKDEFYTDSSLDINDDIVSVMVEKGVYESESFLGDVVSEVERNESVDLYESIMGAASQFIEECKYTASDFFMVQKSFQQRTLDRYPAESPCADFKEAVVLFCLKRMQLESLDKVQRDSQERDWKSIAKEFGLDYLNEGRLTENYDLFRYQVKTCVSGKVLDGFSDKDDDPIAFMLSHTERKIERFGV